MENQMKKNLIQNVIFCCGAVVMSLFLTSCDEFGPVFTGKYDNPDVSHVYTDADMEAMGLERINIADLKSQYTLGNPFVIYDNVYVKGQVTTSDQSGNFYRTFYIQDETGGIEIKIGKTGLYNNYKVGQWVYVKCQGLSLGSYNGLIQIGYEDLTGNYETAYMDASLLVDNYVFCGELDKPVAPLVISDASGIVEANIGRYCTLSGLTYKDEIFAFIDNNDDERIYLSDQSYNVYTWAMSKQGEYSVGWYIQEGYFDEVINSEFFGGNAKEEQMRAARNNFPDDPVYVNQYFTLDGVDIQVRTSGYARFANVRLDGDSDLGVPDVMSASAAGKVALTGILTIFEDEYQFSLIDLTGVNVVE